MGLIGIVISSELNSDDDDNLIDLTIETGGYVTTVPLLSSPGIDSVPVENDYVACISHPGGDSLTAVGIGDPVKRDDLKPGEILIYSRDARGVLKASIKLDSEGGMLITTEKSALELKPDGSAAMSNDFGSVDLETSGRVSINGSLTVEP